MNDKSKRRRRRNDLERMKRRARRLCPGHPKAVKYANNRTPCSCEMCGNPRRHRGEVTWQEVKAAAFAAAA